MNSKQLFALCRKAVAAWADDYAPSMGAAISYYTIFSLAPLLVIVIAIAGALFGHDAAQAQIVAQVSGLVGREGATAVEALLHSVADPERGRIAGIISAIVLLVGATSVFAELQSALDRIWHVPEKDKPSGVWSVLRARLLSFGLILGLAFLLIVSLLVSAGLAAFDGWFGSLVPGWEVVLQSLNELISVVIIALLFALIFKLMPTAPIAWRDVWIGAGVTAILFELGKFAIGMYLGKSGMRESFAAAGSLVVLVAWVYYAAQIFLLGAEFTKVYADSHGSLAGVKAQQATRMAAQVAEAGTSIVETCQLAPAGQPEADATARALDQAQRVRQGAAAAFARQLVVLAILVIANLATKRSIQRQRKRLAANRKALRDA